MLQELESEAILERYAVVGAIAALFYAEATPTFDLDEARMLDYEGVSVRIATPEHLVAMAWSAPAPKRLQRAIALLESPGFDANRSREILARHDIPDRTRDAAH